MSEKSLQEELATQLRASEQALDSETLSRLKAARARALEAAQNASAPSQRRFGAVEGWLIAASVAAVAVLVSVSGPSPSDLPTADIPADAMAIEEGPHDDLDLYENLEFYEWLSAQGDLG